MVAAIDLSGLQTVRVECAHGAQAVLTTHGAHLVSWMPAGANEQLFLSDRSALRRDAPIRGGVPVVFPQFASYGPLAHHGLVRTREWRLVDGADAPSSTCARLRIESDADTHALWPHEFACELTVSLGERTLRIELRVENRDAAPFEFRAALHTYLRVDDIGAVRIEGLAGIAYLDRARDDARAIDDDHVLRVRGELDRVYVGAPRRLLLCKPDGDVELAAEGFPDVVVWNPGRDKCEHMADMAPDGYRNMVCIEPAAVAAPIVLAPAAAWTGAQTLAVRA